MRIERIPGVADIIHLDDPHKATRDEIDRIEHGRARLGAILLVIAMLGLIGLSIWIAYA